MATRYEDRQIPQISLADYDNRIDEIAQQLSTAAEHIGFFAIIDHGISPSEMDAIFSLSESFFQLPTPVKGTVHITPRNAGYECRQQIRPSTGAPDEKESYQLQFGENMDGLWISDDELPGFRDKALAFMHRLQSVSEKLMVCFARALGFPDDHFVKAHDVSRPNCQSVLRLLHYFEVPKSQTDGKVYHRAGAHVDWDFLTLLLQRRDQPGLEVCPGREVVTEWAAGEAWTKVDCAPGTIVCNIGDLLMRWSDDRFKSTFHRVKAPVEEGDHYGERYSIAFFNQPCADARIQGPGGKYPLITGEEFTRSALARNYKALQERQTSA